MSVQPPWKYLARKPGSRYKQLFIGRTAARTLYSYYTPGDEWPGQTVEEIAADCGLPIEAVREAITYCESDPPEIREDFTMEEARMQLNGMNDPNYKYHPSPRPLTPEEYKQVYGE